ncbi:MAG TPA: hypothetical protein VMV46_07465 [Thermoanaerobaculia bacterium]|nr:hypothetical protein [Thermoanaerobaculia bacterium]
MTRSKSRSEPAASCWIDGLPEATPADREALRRARRPVPMTGEEYLAFLRSLPEPTREELAARPITTGEPFRL